MNVHAFFLRRDRVDEVSVSLEAKEGPSWTAPTYGGSLPHDYVHLVVEAAFGLSNGFWGRVGAGWDPGALNLAAQAARARGYPVWGADREELLIAEALAATHWFDPTIGDGPRLLDIAATCSDFGMEMPSRFGLNQVAGATLAMRLSRAIFKHPAHFEPSLHVTFSTVDPQRGFAEMLEGLEAHYESLERSG